MLQSLSKISNLIDASKAIKIMLFLNHVIRFLKIKRNCFVLHFIHVFNSLGICNAAYRIIWFINITTGDPIWRWSKLVIWLFIFAILISCVLMRISRALQTSCNKWSLWHYNSVLTALTLNLVTQSNWLTGAESNWVKDHIW